MIQLISYKSDKKMKYYTAISPLRSNSLIQVGMYVLTSRIEIVQPTFIYIYSWFIMLIFFFIFKFGNLSCSLFSHLYANNTIYKKSTFSFVLTMNTYIKNNFKSRIESKTWGWFSVFVSKVVNGVLYKATTTPTNYLLSRFFNFYS